MTKKRSDILKLRLYSEDMELFKANCPSAQLSPWLRSLLIDEVKRLASHNIKAHKYKSQVVSILTKDDALMIGQLTSVIIFLRVLTLSKEIDSDIYRRLDFCVNALDEKIKGWVNDN